MDKLVLAFTIVGAIVMVGSIVGYVLFMRRMRDVISSGSRADVVGLTLGLVLLLFFLGGYLFVAVQTDLTLMTSLILFFGSVFVAIMLSLTARLLETAKERSIEVAEVLIGVVDARDPNLNGHSRHVKEIVLLFYRRLPAHLRYSINPVSLDTPRFCTT